MKTLIKNGQIVDGVSDEIRQKNILIEDDIIIQVDADEVSEADSIVDATGYHIVPGFIDTHSHSDALITTGQAAWPKIMQGITTEVLGQDGISVAPVPNEYDSKWHKNIAGLLGDYANETSNYETMNDYFEHLNKLGIYQNIMYLVPHGNIRMAAMGLENSEVCESILNNMCNLLDKALSAGACGMSTGLVYSPCVYADTYELAKLCEVLSKHQKPLVVHQRSEADNILASMDELITIADQTGMPLHFSHMKICGKKNQWMIEDVLKKLDDAKANGITITYDQYPYIAGSTMLAVILPPWAHEGGTEKMLERLKDTKARERMICDINTGLSGWDNFIDFAGTDGIYITSVNTEKNKHLIGKNLDEVGIDKGKSALEATFDLLIEEDNAVGMYDYYGDESVLKKYMQREEQNFCTDGLLSGEPHPRVYGSYPRALGKYVREENVLTLPQAIKRMTSQPAKVFNIQKRGAIKEGYYADLVMLDIETVNDLATFEQSRQYPEGIDGVMVNGQWIVKNGQQIDKKVGRILT